MFLPFTAIPANSLGVLWLFVPWDDQSKYRMYRGLVLNIGTFLAITYVGYFLLLLIYHQYPGYFNGLYVPKYVFYSVMALETAPYCLVLGARYAGIRTRSFVRGGFRNLDRRRSYISLAIVLLWVPLTLAIVLTG